jgi:hypothetical protein
MASERIAGTSARAEPRPAESDHDAGLRAWKRGDWLAARHALRTAIESHPRKDDRLEAGRILRALEPDRFALGVALLFLLIIGCLFAWLAA